MIDAFTIFRVLKQMYKSPLNMYKSYLHTFVTSCGTFWTLDALDARGSSGLYCARLEDRKCPRYCFETFNIKENLLLQ